MLMNFSVLNTIDGVKVYFIFSQDRKKIDLLLIKQEIFVVYNLNRIFFNHGSKSSYKKLHKENVRLKL